MKNEQQFPYYVEDWLLYLANHITIEGESIDFPFFRNAPVKLANYDRSFIHNTANQIAARSQGLTDGQLATAVIIITKYQRQISKRTGRDVQYIESEQPLRLPQRRVDRQCSVKKNTALRRYEVKFPYNRKMIDSINEVKNRFGLGIFEYNKQSAQWEIDTLESNLVAVYQFLYNREYFEIDDETAQDLRFVDRCIKNSNQYLPTVDIDAGCNVYVRNTNQHIDRAIAEDQYLSLKPIDAAFRASLYGLVVGDQLKNLVEQQYSSIANSVLLNAYEIRKRCMTYSETVDTDSIDTLIDTVTADSWVFLTVRNQPFFTECVDQLTQRGIENVHLLHVNHREIHEITKHADILKNAVVIADVAETKGIVAAFNTGRTASVDFIENIDKQCLKMLYIRRSEDRLIQ